MKKVSIVGYSERGLVNEVVRHLADQPNDLRTLVEAIEWRPSDRRISELSTLWGTADRGYLFVEPSFAQFGAPDLVMAIAPDDGTQPLLFFIEAKVVSYEKSARANQTGMEDPRYNSSINGQLSLRHRLATALASSTGSDNLTEPQAVWEQAQRQLCDPLQKPRCLKKQRNMKGLVDRLRFGNLVDQNAFLQRCFFVALTDDDKAPGSLWDGDTAPCYFGNRLWTELARQHTGWLGWKRVGKALNMGVRPEWKDCLNLCGAAEPEGEAALGLARQVAGYVAGLAQPKRLRIKECSESLSLYDDVAGAVVAKVIVADGGTVWLGLSIDRKADASFNKEWERGGRKFRCKALDADFVSDENLRKAVQRYFGY